MRQRIISGVIIAVVTIALALIGGYPVGIVLLVCSMIAYHELVRACKKVGDRDRMDALEIAGLLATVIYYAGILFLKESVMSLEFFTILVIISLILVVMMLYVLTYPKFHADQVMTAVFAFLYAPVMMSCIYRARELPYGIYVYALIFFCSWICDTCAYAAGRMFGKHKLAPELSPKKTIEGSVGGVVGSVLLCVGTAAVLGYWNPGANFEIEFLILGIFGSIISQIGDLAASAIKRNHGIKDYGNCIPGHGGIMDRFDSVIFTAPIIYLLAVILMRQAA